jgi:glycosyltransferase involved in cell wall biosynthesis
VINGVTIGIPLYNEERFVEAAIRSAARQCEIAWASDNASTDQSAAICERLQPSHPNLRLARQERNRGAWFNFTHVLEQATTPYFMWFGGHDLLPHGYVERLVALLDANADAVMAYGATQYIDLNGEPIGTYDYAYHDLLADKSSSVRTLGLIRFLDDCSLIHGVFRTAALRRACAAVGPGGYPGFDHVLLGHAALEGRFLYDARVRLLRRDVHPVADAAAQFKRIVGQVSNDQAPTKQQLSRRTMQQLQYELAIQASRDMGGAGLMYRLWARHHLVRRFGTFGDTLTTQGLDRLLQRRLVRASLDRLGRVL